MAQQELHGRWYLNSDDPIARFVGPYFNVLATPETETVEDGEDQAVPEEEEAVLEEEEEEDACWFVDLRSGETTLFALNPGQRAWVSHAQLVPASSAAAGQTVRVALRTKAGDVQTLVLSANRNVVSLPRRSTVMLDEEFWLEREDDGLADAVVRFVVCDGNVHAIPEMGTVEESVEDGERPQAVLWEEEEEEEEEDGEAAASSEDYDNDVGFSDYDGEEEEEEEEEESDGASEVAGFMRVEDADTENQGGGGDAQILVLYRYTRFSAAWSDGSVEARGSTKEHQLRFVAAAGHGARSLAWAGASLAPLVYPEGCSQRLRELWTDLVSHVSLPPGAARVKVFVDVGILRLEDCTPASKGNMRAALEGMKAQPWPTRFTGMELNLPEPVQFGHDDEDKAAHNHDNHKDGEQRPTKRRRVVAAEEDCGVSLEVLEGDDLAAWPGCGKPHVFHGRCLELVLDKTETCPTCPICRRGLYIF